MKTTVLFQFVALFLLQFSSYAQDLSAVEIYSENGDKFTLSIDGKQINDSPASNVRATDLRGDFFRLLVQFEDKSLGTVSQGFAIDPGMEQKAVIMLKKNGKYAIRPSSEPYAYVATSQKEQAKPAPTEYQMTDAPPSSSPSGRVKSSTTQTTEQVSMDVDMMGTKVGVSVSVDDQTTGSYTTTTTTTTQTETYGMDEDMEMDEPAEEVVIACPEMATSEFNELMGQLKSKSFSDSKMTLMKQVLNNNCLSTDQIQTVMSTFTYEEDKLAFAKLAYDHCTDHQNYWKLNKAFEFEMTMDELNEFLESK